jgi:hypothetical protein
MRRWAKLFGSIVILAVIGEISVRGCGIVDFPLYDVGKDISYVTRPNQNGAFLWRNDWHFNDRGMPIARNWDRGLHPDLLLIGNSIVMGGNPYRQKDKLTSQLQRLLGDRLTVWPMAVGGWNQANEAAYLARNPDVVENADYFAWEFMRGSLHGLTPWAGEYVFPTHRPFLAGWYVVRRYLIPRILPSFAASELPIFGGPQAESVHQFDEALANLAGGGHRKRKGLIWLYPTAEELAVARAGGEWLPERAQVEALANRYGLKVVDVATFQTWNRSMYSSGGVHPTVEGTGIIASILNDALRNVAQ